MMKGILVQAFGPPSECKVAEIPIPKPGVKQVLIKTKYVGINPVDTYIRSGLFATYAKPPALPYTPSNDCSGVVEMVGEGVTEFAPGDPVFTTRCVSGACAEYTVADVSRTFPLNIKKLTFQEGACLGTPYFTSYRALIIKGGAKPGQSVLIHGASGGFGTLCVQMAKHLGLRVYATAGTAKGLEVIKACGADHVYNHKDEEHCQQIMNDTKGEGVNLIIEVIANVNLKKDFEMVSAGGRIIIIGNKGHKMIEVNARQLLWKESLVVGCLIYCTTPEEWKEMRLAYAEHQKGNWLRPVVNKEYTLSQVDQAHEYMANTSGAAGNLIISTTTL